MFTKPFRVKSNTPVKGSERKKIKAELQKCFPTITEEDLTAAVPNKEEMSVMKIETHSGEIVSAHVVGKKPIVFHVRDKLYPTIYLLWILPSRLLPYFTTWHEVVPKLNNGADLMLPGIIIHEELGLRAYGRLKKGEMVAVNTNRNSAAVAVGLTALSSDDMYMAARKGKGVEILHCICDYLWQVGTKESPPDLGLPGAKQESAEAEKQRETTVITEIPEIQSHDEAVTNTPAADEGPTNDSSEQDIDQRTPQEQMDDLLRYCFLKAMKTSARKLELPALTSNFYRLHMVPACPADKSIDVKKSSYKKLSKFLESMLKAGVINIKELTKGVESITLVQHDHELIRSFRIDPTDVKVEQSPALDSVAAIEKHLPPVITRLYGVNAATQPLFTGTYLKGTHLTAQQVRQHLTEYVKKNELQGQTKQSQVTMDPILSDVLLKKGETAAALSWEEIMTRCLAKMSTVHEMLFPGQSTPVVVKGELEPIDISTANRAGNKKVTLISGLETYRIDLEDFARKCQHGVAASTTITTSPGKKGQVVLVQGNQVGFVGGLLVGEYGIPKQYIQGFDVKKSKK